MSNEKRILIALFSLAFGLRILYAVVIGSDPSINSNPITPAVTYGYKISSDISWLREPYSPNSPGYPLFLGIIFLLTGKHIWPAVVIQALLGGVLVIVVFMLGKLLGGYAVGFISALWTALYIHHIHFSMLLVRDALSCLLFLSLALAFALPFKKMRYSILAAVLYASLLHVDPQFMILYPVIAGFILIFISRHMTINIHYLVLFTSALIVLLAPWAVRNYFVYRQFIPVSLEASHYLSPARERIPSKIKALARAGEPIISPSRSSRMKKNAVEFWRIIRLGRRSGKSESEKTPGWSFRHNLISLADYGLLLPFFLFGIISSFRRRNRVGILLFLLSFSYFAIRLFFGGSERSRLQIEPFIILLAFYALVHIRDYFRMSAKASADAH